MHYRVKSQSDSKVWYDVVKQYGRNLGGREDGRFTCTCSDFKFRSVICKHIHSVLFSTKLRNKIVSEDIAQSIVIPNPESNPIECLKCKTLDQVVKDGKRYNKRGEIQKYLCRNCNYRFVVNLGLNAKKDPKVICASIDLYLKGISLRKFADHVKQFYGVNISDNSVLRWVQRFGEVVAPFVDSLKAPQMSGIYHVDEMVVHVRKEEMDKGHYQWLWNLMDETTRYWVTSKISQRRETEDAQAVFQNATSKSRHTKAIIHDGLPSYNTAFQKEYYTRQNPKVKNISSISVRDQGLNSRVERLNGTMRDCEKVMRGMNKAESTQKLIEAFRIHYNFCREHSTLGKTPAEAAGIKLELGQNKIENLIKLGSYKN
ncbi:MAG TPA: DDE-type integrase/transposase/recombinase [Candidatus Nitrosotenuis sp.]|nr:DDE-type integrase/transposase/recombinase [Candidatus Nitrosotenuis sp.]